MKPGDYIELSDIKGPEHHQRIRDAVRAMGYRVSHYFGRYDSNLKYHCPRLFLCPYGDLIWSRQCEEQQGRINPDDLLGESKPELPPVGEWQPWTGGECPVPGNTDVQVFLANGTKNDGAAGAFIWHYVGNDCDIVAFRVIEYPTENVTIPKPDSFSEHVEPLERGIKKKLGAITVVELRYEDYATAKKAIEALKGEN